MNYQFEKIFIGTLVENETENMSRCVVYQGDILCTVSKDNVVRDLINGNLYDYLGFENHRSALNGTTYVYSLSEAFPKDFKSNILSKATLIELARELNANGRSIKLPEQEFVKTKRK
ncbi:MAG: hypothetical protein PHT75_02370 [Bacilli bacterium]|nr:hypothetical protein [Bacilli bacterium]MDD3304957.1 hypothetical protein [Bacilli bacterium]MDD4054070.1 hypothetical protein [Bacilli bacterium]MDD4411410.1 hypothetical protein [Bacilli bacterium]